MILSMLVEIVARTSSAVMISVNPISISSVSTSALGFDKHRLIFPQIYSSGRIVDTLLGNCSGFTLRAAMRLQYD